MGRDALKPRKRPRGKHGPAGFVYLIVNPAFPHHVKVGSCVSLTKRLAQYQTGDPHRAYRYIAHATFPNRVQAESELLRRNASHVRFGEWLEIDEAGAKRLLVRLKRELQAEDYFAYRRRHPRVSGRSRGTEERRVVRRHHQRVG